MALPGVITLLAVLLQAPQPAAPAQPLEPASVEGTIIRAGSSPPAPVPRARVVLNRVGPDTVTFTVAADDAGRFAIRGVPQGTYNLMATRDGYVRSTKAILLSGG